MAPRNKARVDRKSTLRLVDDSPPAKKPKIASFVTPPAFTFSSFPSSSSQLSIGSRASQSSISSQAADLQTSLEVKSRKSQSIKGKGKVVENVRDDRLWVDQFAPETEVELAVHKRKVEDVRRWLGESFSNLAIAKYRRLLVLTGPSGVGKTATLKVLSRDMRFTISEWISAQVTDGSKFTDEHDFNDEDSFYESAMDKFEVFLTRAGNYRSIFSTSTAGQPGQSSATTEPKDTIILLEDLPNVLHAGVRERFHAAIQRHMHNSNVPIVIIVSDAGVRAEGDEFSLGSYSRRTRDEEVVSGRTVIPPGLGAAYFTEIAFNPIAPTFLTGALKRIRTRANAQAVSDTVLTNIIDSVAGDIRAAIMALEFAYVRVGVGGKKRRSRSDPVTIPLEAATRKESALFLFHLLGKVLYNKRKGDPPSSSATKREAAALRELDMRLNDEPPLQPWLAHEARGTSRVSADELYTSTPIDASLFSLYIHQNYTPFCSDLEHCEMLIDNLSWVDANGGDNWYQQNPYAFHLYTLGTLHALPVPVPRSGQKFYKPEFFDVLKRTRDASDAVERVRGWLCERIPASASTWTQKTVALELGAVLRARDSGLHKPPREHALFSEMRFVQGTGHAEEAHERETGRVEEVDEDEVRWKMLNQGDAQGTWLEDDDIEEW